MKINILKAVRNGLEGAFTRNRILPFSHLIISILRMGKTGLQREMDAFLKETEDDAFDIRRITKSGFSQSRKHLAPKAFLDLNNVIVQDFYKEVAYLGYRNHRILAVDGGFLNLPNHESIREEYGTRGMGRGRLRALKKSMCLLSLFVVLTYGCGNKKGIKYERTGQGGSYRILRRTFDEKGDLAEEAELSKDSIRDGFYKKYASGKIESIGYYKGNRRDSSWLYFNPSGDTIRKENWFNGKPFGEQFQFYSKAPGDAKSAIHKYGFNNLDGEKVFQMSFDSLSAIKSFEGSPVYMAYTADTIKVNSDFELMYFFGIPPSCHYVMAIKECDAAEKKQLSPIHVSDTSEDLQDLFFGKKYMVIKNYKKKGVYDWQLDLLIEDGKNNIIVHDTSALRIKVD